MSHSTNRYEDVVWMQQVAVGDEQAFERLLAKYQQPIYNLCYRMLGDGMAAEDAMQEVFLRVYTKHASYDPDRQFSSWLFAIASHYCQDQLKSAQRRVQLWADTPQQQVTAWDQVNDHPETLLVQTETAAQMHTLVNHLPSDYRRPIVLKYWHMLSVQEIARRMDTTVNTVKGRLFRARKSLAQALTVKKSR